MQLRSAVFALEPSWRPSAGSKEDRRRRRWRKMRRRRLKRRSASLLSLSHDFLLLTSASVCTTPRSRTRLLDVAAGTESGGGGGGGGGEMSHPVKVTSRPRAALRAGSADLSAPSRPHGRPQVCLTRMLLLLLPLLSSRPQPAHKTAASRHFGTVTSLVSRPWDEGPLGLAAGDKNNNKS